MGTGQSLKVCVEMLLVRLTLTLGPQGPAQFSAAWGTQIAGVPM